MDSIKRYKQELQNILTAPGISIYDTLKLYIRKLITGECRNLEDPVELMNDIVRGYPQDSDISVKGQPADVDLKYLMDEKKAYESLNEESDEEYEDVIVQDVSEISNMFTVCGEGLNELEYLQIKFAFKRILEDYPIENIRFWGKIYGINCNYYVIECQPSDTDIFEDDKFETETGDVDRDKERTKEEDPPFPKNVWKAPPEIPKEEVGEGVNSHVYFVSNYPCGTYTRLPHAEPKHIVASQLIYSYFTGDLNAAVSCFPPFPGSEAQYLRAQIARISSATQLAPLGYYRHKFEDVETNEEDEEVKVECELNEDYVATELENMGLEQWVHCRPYILPQGRVTWWNPKDNENEEGSVDDISGSEAGDDSVPPLEGLYEEPEPERGPPILTPISEDLEVHGQIPWIIRQYKRGRYLRVSSLLWPGAHTVAREGNFDNIYIGWGIKATGPPGYQISVPKVQWETRQEPVESVDPTPLEEAAAEKKPENEEDVSEEEDEESSEDD